MKTSDDITVTDARLRNALKSEFDFSMMPGINNKLFNVASDSKIHLGVITKFYPYLDKAEVKLDHSQKLILCKILHRYGGDMIDFYTPLEHEQIFDEKLKEPAIIPRSEQHVCVLHIRDDVEDLIVGYYQTDEIVGFNPAKPGNVKFMSLGEANNYWIKFGRDGLDIRIPENLVMNQGRLDEEMISVDYADSDNIYSKTEIDAKLDEINTDYNNLEENEIYLNMETLSNGYLRIDVDLIKKEE